MKKTYINTPNSNLLTNKEFKSALRFEATYALIVKGGYQPKYHGETKQKRLVNNINLLISSEIKELIQHYPLFSN